MPATVAPLPQREGVVVGRTIDGKATIVVARGNQRVYVIHTLRRLPAGTRVRVGGIKWGTPTSGIKWSRPPAGIKWGIKWARNGTFQSRLTVLPGRLQSASLRGGRIVRRFGASGVAVSYPGATFVVKVSRRAVWLPGGKMTSASTGLGEIGSTVDLRLAIGRRGGLVATRVVQQSPPVAGAAIPLAGTIVAADPVNRTLTIRSSNDLAFPLDILVTVPVGVDLGIFPIGSSVATKVVPSAADVNVFYAAEISRNDTFAQADAEPAPTASASPATPAPETTTTVVLPVPNPAHLAGADDLRTKWITGNAAGLITRNGLFQSEDNRLTRVKNLIAIGDRPGAIAELTRFEERIDDCRPGHGQGGDLNGVFADEMTTLSAALRQSLATA